MGRILFVSFYDLNRLMFFLPLTSGNCGPFVRRKDLGKFRSSLPAEPAVCKALLILLHCAGSCALASRSFVTTETHCLVPGTGRPGFRVAPDEGLLDGSTKASKS